MLQINSVTKTFDDNRVALKDVSLDIKKGLFGLLGPNGAGKSTLMRIIASLATPDSGSLMFDGIDILEEPQQLRQRLGYLPQEFGVYPRISAYELLDHLAILKGIANKYQRNDTVLSLLHSTNLYTHRNTAVSNYSSGMRQRFGIAQALLGDPDLLIVDEPTAGLDPEERNRFHELLVDLSNDKVIILSTHIVEDVSELCLDMAVLGNGEILLHGNPIELTRTLEDKIWRKAVTKFEIDEYEQAFSVISKRLFGGNTILHVIADNPPPGFESAPATLQDVYFNALDSSRQYQTTVV